MATIPTEHDAAALARRLLSWVRPPTAANRLKAKRQDSGGEPSAGPKRINLALQGGGAHGAFTWGVLDGLLADGRLTVDGISGTSAGAVNAVMLAHGLATRGADGARECLAAFWNATGHSSGLPSLQRDVVDRLFPFFPGRAWFDAVAQFWGPQQFNPLNINPLKELIERFVDFDAIRRGRHPLFIAATNVETGDLRIFTRDDISAEAVMASAALPTLFRAVEIDGAPYWDGGYTANPPLTPFLRATETEDVLLVQINPLTRSGAPADSNGIASRASEISFNTALLADLRAVDFVNRMIDDGRLPRGTAAGHYRRIRLHRIVLDGNGELFDARSKATVDREFFAHLHALGEDAARRFLTAHFDDLGRRSTLGDVSGAAA